MTARLPWARCFSGRQHFNPMPLPLERICGQNDGAMWAVHSTPIDGATAQVQFAEARQHHSPILASAAQTRQPRACVAGHASRAKANKDRLRTNLDVRIKTC